MLRSKCKKANLLKSTEKDEIFLGKQSTRQINGGSLPLSSPIPCGNWGSRKIAPLAKLLCKSLLLSLCIWDLFVFAAVSLLQGGISLSFIGGERVVRRRRWICSNIRSIQLYYHHSGPRGVTGGRRYQSGPRDFVIKRKKIIYSYIFIVGST